MRLTSVVLHSSYTLEDIEFSLREQLGNRYIVRNIVGIDAEELIPKFYGFGQETGSAFHDRVMKPRDIVMRVALNPKYRINEGISEIRDRLYRLISTNRTGQIQLQFKSGATTVAVISGMITKFEVPYFTKLPELQITFNCPDPTFRSIHPVHLTPAELPTANPLIINDDSSTAHHGFSFKIKFTAAASAFEIKDHATDPDWQFVVAPVGGFDIDDELHISSEYGNKQVFYVGASSINLMDKIVTDSIWPTIFPGYNYFHIDQMASIDWLELKYYYAYWGV